MESSAAPGAKEGDEETDFGCLGCLKPPGPPQRSKGNPHLQDEPRLALPRGVPPSAIEGSDRCLSQLGLFPSAVLAGTSDAPRGDCIGPPPPPSPPFELRCDTAPPSQHPALAAPVLLSGLGLSRGRPRLQNGFSWVGVGERLLGGGH